MTLIYDINTVVATGSEAIFKLKEVLKGAGWTVVSSSDASTYDATSNDVITSAAGMANNSAWFVVQEPGTSGRSWCFQRGTTNVLWRIKNSPLAGFVDASATATRTPLGSDQTILWGGGTDAAPTYATFFGTDGTYRWHAIADNASVGPSGNTAYGFWAFSTVSATGLNMTVVGQDPLVVGSYASLTGSRSAPTSGDADPVVYFKMHATAGTPLFLNGSTLSINSSSDTLANLTIGYSYKFNMAGGVYTTALAINHRSSISPQVFGTDPTSGADVNGPMVVGRPNTTDAPARSTYIGIKGVPTNLRISYTARSYPDTTDLSTNAKVYIGHCLLPWPTGSAPQL